MHRAIAPVVLVVITLLLATACESPPETPESAIPDGERIDLTHPFNEETIYWPTAPQTFELEEDFVGDTGDYFYAAHVLATSEHGGTHLDAPFHFAEDEEAAQDQWTTDEIPLDRLMGNAVVIDVRDAAAEDRNYQVQTSDFEQWEDEHGAIPDEAIVLLDTGSAQYWPDAEAYIGTDERGEEALADLQFPGLHPEAAEWLVENRSIHAIGLDTPSIDYGPSEGFESHRVLFAENIPVFENLNNLSELPPTGAYVMALPMHIEGGSGSPLRAVAVLP